MIVQDGLKNLVFDLGGVILNIDFTKCFDAFQGLGIDNFGDLCSRFSQVDLFNQLETGRISPQDFYAFVRELGPSGLTDSQIERAWNAMILDFPPERIGMLKSLRKKYRLYLISNTNLIHYNKYTFLLHKHFDIPTLDELFDRVVFSFECGFRKPDPAIYQYLLEVTGIDPAESLFIDDGRQNLPSAESLGIRTRWLAPGEEITSLFLY